MFQLFPRVSTQEARVALSALQRAFTDAERIIPGVTLELINEIVDSVEHVEDDQKAAGDPQDVGSGLILSTSEGTLPRGKCPGMKVRERNERSLEKLTDRDAIVVPKHRVYTSCDDVKPVTVTVVIRIREGAAVVGSTAGCTLRSNNIASKCGLEL